MMTRTMIRMLNREWLSYLTRILFPSYQNEFLSVYIAGYLIFAFLFLKTTFCSHADVFLLIARYFDLMLITAIIFALPHCLE